MSPVQPLPHTYKVTSLHPAHRRKTPQSTDVVAWLFNGTLIALAAWAVIAFLLS